MLAGVAQELSRELAHLAVLGLRELLCERARGQHRTGGGESEYKFNLLSLLIYLINW